MKRVHLELGGKAPMVVLDDADPATVAEAIKIGGYFNSGPGLHRVVAHPRAARRSTTTSSPQTVKARRVA